MYACFNALKAFKASSESDTHSNFLLAPSPAKCLLSGWAVHANPLMILL